MLSNPATRRIYDRYGELGLTTLGVVKSPSLVEFMLNTSRIKFIVFVIFSSLFLAGFSPLFAALKISNKISWTWYVIVAPMLCFLLVLLLFCTLFIYLGWKAMSIVTGEESETRGSSEDKESLDKTAFIFLTTFLLAFFLLILAQILLFTSKLEGHINVSWWIILLPYFIVETIHFLRIVLSLLVINADWENCKEEVVSPFDHTLSHPFAYLCYLSLRWCVMRVLFVDLVIFKLGLLSRLPWAVVFAPLYLILTSSLIIDYKMDKRRLPYEEARFTPDQYDNTNNNRGPKVMFKTKYALYTILVTVLMTSLLLLNLRLGLGRPNWTVTLLPVYICSVLFLLVVGILGLIAYALVPSQSQLSPDEELSEIIVDGEPPHSLSWFRKAGYVFGPRRLRLRPRTTL